MAEIPKLAGHWPRAAVIEIDRTTFAALWMAWDGATDVAYLYDEYVAPLSALPVHGQAVRKRGAWIPCLFDPAGAGREEADGFAIAEQIAELDVNILTVPLQSEAAVLLVADRLMTGRLKVGSMLQQWRTQYETWQRNEKGELPEEGHLLMRGTAMLVQSGQVAAVTENRAASDAEGYDMGARTRSKVTGY